MSEIENAEVVNPEALAKRPEPGAVGAALPYEQITRPAITAAQAKVDAVAALTATAYARAAMLAITKEESAALLADFPDEAFKPGAAGKENLLYLEHAFLRDRFTQVFGMGQWAIVPRNRWAESFITKAWPGKPSVEGSRVYVEAMLIVRGCFVGEAVGAMEYYPSNGAQNYGDAVEGAKTASFRRCAKEFGVGLQAWKSDWCAGWWERRNAGKRQAAPTRPAAPPPQRQAPPTAAAPAPKPAPTAAAPVANEFSRSKMIHALKARPGEPNRDTVTEFFAKAGAIMPNEPLEELPLRFVPATERQMNLLAAAITDFANGERAQIPYPVGEIPQHPDPDPVATAKAKAQAPAAAPAPAADDVPTLPMLQGVISQVSVKEGKIAKGPWKLFGIKIGDVWVNTFSKTLGEMAQANKGQPVTLYYEAGEKGNTAVELVLFDGTRHTAGESK